MSLVGGFLKWEVAYNRLFHRTLADVDKDGKLKAEEFILAMHLVDAAKSGQALPLTLPTELVPPSQRSDQTHDGQNSDSYLMFGLEVL